MSATPQKSYPLADANVSQETLQAVEDIHTLFLAGLITPMKAHGRIIEVIEEQPRKTRHLLTDHLKRSDWKMDRTAATYYELEHKNQ